MKTPAAFRSTKGQRQAQRFQGHRKPEGTYKGEAGVGMR